MVGYLVNSVLGFSGGSKGEKEYRGSCRLRKSLRTIKIYISQRPWLGKERRCNGGMRLDDRRQESL